MSFIKVLGIWYCILHSGLNNPRSEKFQLLINCLFASKLKSTYFEPLRQTNISVSFCTKFTFCRSLCTCCCDFLLVTCKITSFFLGFFYTHTYRFKSIGHCTPWNVFVYLDERIMKVIVYLPQYLTFLKLKKKKRFACSFCVTIF